jgi:hypothetical protein
VNVAGARVWRSNGEADLELLLISDTFLELRLPLHHVQMTMTLSEDNTKATNGMIGGILDTEEFVNALATLVGSFDPSLCPPSATFESIAQQIWQASDILTDGSQSTAAVCNGISLGFGFDATAAQLGTVIDAPVVPNPCP